MKTIKRQKLATILEVLRPTPGNLHYWVRARVGLKEIIIKKETKNIDPKLIEKYKRSLFNI